MNKVCPNCDGQGWVVIEVPDYVIVTRDMAIDAGEPNMEGTQVLWGSHAEQAWCSYCEGTGFIEEKKP